MIPSQEFKKIKNSRKPTRVKRKTQIMSLTDIKVNNQTKNNDGYLTVLDKEI